MGRATRLIPMACRTLMTVPNSGLASAAAVARPMRVLGLLVRPLRRSLLIGACTKSRRHPAPSTYAKVVLADHKMQIPAGVGRQGSAERLTDGGWQHPVARQGPATEIEVHDANPRKTILWAKTCSCVQVPRQSSLALRLGCAKPRPSGFGLRCTLGGRHDLARDLPHMLAGVVNWLLRNSD